MGSCAGANSPKDKKDQQLAVPTTINHGVSLEDVSKELIHSRTAPASTTTQAFNDFLKMNAAKHKIKDLEDHIRPQKGRNIQTILQKKGITSVSTPAVFQFDYGKL